MTLGEHIQQLRKQTGLSQEALGEALGVTRQSISKWESDGAIPEVEKLIAMSRLFGVTVGKLLQVEESAPEGEVPHELTERELSAVEAIVAKYLSAIDQTHAGPRPAPKPRHRKRNIVLAVIAVIAAVWAVGQIKTMNDRIQSLQTNLSNVRSDVSRQGAAMGSITDRIEEILERQNSVTAAESYDTQSVDVAAGTATYRLEATPKEYREGMTAQFTAKGEGGTVTAEGVLDPATLGFSADLTAPLEDNTVLSVSFTSDLGVQTRVLGYGFARSETLPILDISDWLWADDVPADGVFHWGDHLDVRTSDALFKTGQGGITAVSVQSVTLSIHVDGELVHTIPVREDQLDRMDRRPDQGGEGAAPYFGVPMDLTLTLREGSTLVISAHITDNFGRAWDEVKSAYVVQNGSLQQSDGFYS